MKDLTKQAIATALLKQLDSRPISQITVKDICRDCDINRQTFYYHFQDIYDLFFWIMERDLREHIARSGVSRSDARGYLHALFGYFTEHERQIRHGYDALNRVQYETLLKERARPMIAQRLLSYEESAFVREEDLEFLVSFYTLSLSGLLITWIEEGLPDEYRIRLDKYCMVVDGSMKTLLLKFAQPPKSSGN